MVSAPNPGREARPFDILVLGAGAVGGYLGARLAGAGARVSHLVRSPRAERLRCEGLRIRSPLGDANLQPRLMVCGEPLPRFDLMILPCKAYQLDAALESIAPAVGPESAVLPLLNGIAHLPLLDSRFGRRRVLGGTVHLALTLTADGTVVHLNDFHRLIYGPRHPAQRRHCAALESLLAATTLDHRCSAGVEQDMWDKLVFLATLAAATCTLRGSIGEILATGAGEAFILGLLEEAIAVARACGHPPRVETLDDYRALLTDRRSDYTASMLRDVENGAPTEADHILGDLLRRGAGHGLALPRLDLAFAHLQVYEARRRRRAGPP